jgi:hypothetical protein
VRRKAVAVLGVDDREALLHVLDAADLHETTRQQTLAPGRRSPVCSALAACDATRRDAASPASQSARDAGACVRARVRGSDQANAGQGYCACEDAPGGAAPRVAGESVRSRGATHL